MAKLGPISRANLVRALRKAGFEGPFSGTDHAFMRLGERVVRVPNPHGNDIGPNLLAEILRQAGISRKKWEQLR